ncbi:MAG: MlaD family protein [bacterium]
MSAGPNGDLRKEMMVGVFAFAVIVALFMFSIFVTGGTFWKKGREVNVTFSNVMGLRKGDNVVTRGMTVGEVKNLEIDRKSGRVRVTCMLVTPLELRTDCSAAVVPTSILGGRQLALFEGEKAELLADNALIPGQDPQDIMNDAGDAISQIRDTINKGLLDDLSSAVKQVKEIAEKINRGEGTLGLLVNDKTVYNDIAAVSSDLKAITAGLKEGKGTLAKLMNEDTVYNDLKTTTANLRDISQRLSDGKGSLGKLLSEDESIYDDAKGVLKDFRGAIDDYRESSPILTFTTIMFGAF